MLKDSTTGLGGAAARYANKGTTINGDGASGQGGGALFLCDVVMGVACAAVEPARIDSNLRCKAMQLGDGVRGQVEALFSTPQDCGVIDVYGHAWDLSGNI